MSFFDDGEGGAAPRPGADLESDDDEDSSDSSPPSAEERGETIRDAGGDTSQSSGGSSQDSSNGTSVADLPGVSAPADTRPPSPEERADTVRDAGGGTSQSSDDTSQDTSQSMGTTSQDSSQSSGSNGPPQASDRDFAGINRDAVDQFERVQDAKGGDIQGHEAGVPISSAPDSPVGDAVSQLENETVTDLGRGDVSITREQRNGDTFVSASLTDDALADERDERREVASGINQASDRDFAGINRRELDAFAGGDGVSEADEVFARREAVDTVEQQLEEQTGADDLEAGADFTVSETESGFAGELTDEGREQINQASEFDESNQFENFAGGFDVLAGSTDEAVGRAGQAAGEGDVAGVGDALAGSTDEAVGRAVDEARAGDLAGAADNLGGDLDDAVRATAQGIETVDTAAEQQRPESVDQDSLSIEERLGLTEESQRAAGEDLVEGNPFAAADDLLGNVDERVQAASFSQDTAEAVTGGGFLTEEQEQDLEIASRQFQSDAEVLSDQIAAATLQSPSTTQRALDQSRPEGVDVPIGGGASINLDPVREGESVNERLAEGAIQNTLEMGDVFGAARGVETGVEVAQSTPEVVSNGGAAALATSGVAIGRETGTAAAQSFARTPTSSVGSLAGGIGAGLAAGGAAGAALRASRLTRVPGVSASDTTGRLLTGGSDSPDTPAPDTEIEEQLDNGGGLGGRMRESVERAPDVTVRPDADSRLEIDPALKTQLRQATSRENIAERLTDPDDGALPINRADRQQLDVFSDADSDQLLGPVEGRVKGAAVSGESALRRFGQRAREGLAPMNRADRQQLDVFADDDSDQLLGPIQGRAQSAALRFETGVRNLPDRFEDGIGPMNRADRQQLDVFADADADQLLGPVEGRVKGAAVSGESALRRFGQRAREGLAPMNRGDRQQLDIFEDDDSDQLLGPIQGRAQSAALRFETGVRNLPDRFEDGIGPTNQADRQQLDVFQDSDEQLSGPVEGLFQSGTLAVREAGERAEEAGRRVGRAAAAGPNTVDRARDSGLYVSPIRPERPGRVLEDEIGGDLGPFMDGDDTDTAEMLGVDESSAGRDDRLNIDGTTRDRDGPEQSAMTLSRAETRDAPDVDDSGGGLGFGPGLGAGAGALGADRVEDPLEDAQAATESSVGDDLGVGEAPFEASFLDVGEALDVRTDAATNTDVGFRTDTGGGITQPADTRQDLRQDTGGSGRSDFRSDFDFLDGEERRDDDTSRSEQEDEELFATGIASGEDVFEDAGFDVDDELDDLGF